MTSCTEVTERSSVLFTCTVDTQQHLHDYDVANLARNVGLFITLYNTLRSMIVSFQQTTKPLSSRSQRRSSATYSVGIRLASSGDNTVSLERT